MRDDDPYRSLRRRRDDEALEEWIASILGQCGRDDTLRHVRGVSTFAMETFGSSWQLTDEDVARLRAAALAHDIAAAVDRSAYLGIARAEGWSVCEAEHQHPMLLHQRVSSHVLRVFGATSDASVLVAVDRHTTLGADPPVLLQHLWISDKLAWDQPGRPPFWATCTELLARGELAGAIRVVLESWDATIPPARRHPELVAALQWFSREAVGA